MLWAILSFKEYLPFFPHSSLTGNVSLEVLNMARRAVADASPDVNGALVETGFDVSFVSLLIFQNHQLSFQKFISNIFYLDTENIVNSQTCHPTVGILQCKYVFSPTPFKQQPFDIHDLFQHKGRRRVCEMERNPGHMCLYRGCALQAATQLPTASMVTLSDINRTDSVK